MTNVRQYIGARYVIKIYENSQDPGSAEWEANTYYEPLIMVSYRSSSYLSKKDVPANIGNPTDNPEYWTLTGAYNGQVAELQRQVQAISAVLGDENSGIVKSVNDLETVANSANIWHDKKIVVYGDSLSTVTYNYWRYMVEMDPTIQLTNRAVAGTRIQDGYTLLQNATDLNQYDIIVLAYGSNSWANTSLREMVNSYVSCFSIISTQAPNARIVCIAPYYHYNPNYGVSSVNPLGFGIYDYSNAIVNICTMYGGIAFNLYELTGVNQYNYMNYMTESTGGLYLHENERLGRRIANILLTATPATVHNTSYIFMQTGDTSTNGLVIVKMNNMIFIYQRGTCTVEELTALNLNHIAPSWNISGLCRDRSTGMLGMVALTSTGTLSIAWPSGSTGTHVQGLQMYGIFGNFQPH